MKEKSAISSLKEPRWSAFRFRSRDGGADLANRKPAVNRIGIESSRLSRFRSSRRHSFGNSTQRTRYRISHQRRVDGEGCPCSIRKLWPFPGLEPVVMFPGYDGGWNGVVPRPIPMESFTSMLTRCPGSISSFQHGKLMEGRYLRVNFYRAHCAACHGLDRSGTLPGAFPLERGERLTRRLS